MKKAILFALFFSVICLLTTNSNSFQDATKPYTFVARDTIKATKLNANWDTLYSRENDLYDSLELRFLRFTDFKDSTIDSIKVNKIMSNPSIDSIQGLNILRGNPDIDSISGVNVLRGNPDIDSISGLNVLRGNPDIDSISGLNSIKGNPIFDSIQGVDIIRGNPDIDSISGTTKFTGAKTFVDAATFSSTASVDSLFSTKGISATNFNGNLKGTMINTSASIVEDTVSGDSLYANYPIQTFRNAVGITLDTVTDIGGTYSTNGLVTFVKLANDTTFFNLSGEVLQLKNTNATVTYFNVNGVHYLVGVANR